MCLVFFLALCPPSCVEVYELCAILLCKRLNPLWSCLVERVEILLDEGGNVELGTRNLKHILLLSLISCIALIALTHTHMLDIVIMHTFVLNQESYWSTSTLNWEESWGEVLGPSSGIRLHVLNIYCVFSLVNVKVVNWLFD